MIAERRRMADELVDWLYGLREGGSGNYQLVPLDERVVHHFRVFGPAAVPEMADRIIAATALALGFPLLSADPIIAESPLVKVVW